jgi:hypothetical protein
MAGDHLQSTTKEGVHLLTVLQRCFGESKGIRGESVFAQVAEEPTSGNAREICQVRFGSIDSILLGGATGPCRCESFLHPR